MGTARRSQRRLGDGLQGSAQSVLRRLEADAQVGLRGNSRGEGAGWDDAQ